MPQWPQTKRGQRKKEDKKETVDGIEEALALLQSASTKLLCDLQVIGLGRPTFPALV